MLCLDCLFTPHEEYHGLELTVCLTASGLTCQLWCGPRNSPRNYVKLEQGQRAAIKHSLMQRWKQGLSNELRFLLGRGSLDGVSAHLHLVMVRTSCLQLHQLTGPVYMIPSKLCLTTYQHGQEIQWSLVHALPPHTSPGASNCCKTPKKKSFMDVCIRCL